ncbi:MAG: threonine-phosphate decarboxylase [wastewater metagenome]|nr:threonine-phosphate decarboxylase [Candidatus Loosdrechtia aerotolerans]
MFKGHGGNIKHIVDYPSDNNSIRGRNNDILDFSASINPLGYPKNVREAIWENFDDIMHYPDIDCSYLRRYIAREAGHSDDEIIVGNGSTELFYLIPRALRPVKGIIFQPTFSEFAEALKCSHTEVVHKMLREEDHFLFHYSKDYFNDEEREIVFLCNPNNPTGQLVEGTVILNMAKQHPRVTFVIDEAFMDFVHEPGKYSVLGEAGTIHNIIVVRSLTKFYGFPGLRVGYLVASKDTVKKMTEYKEPWSVNAFAQYAARAALEDKEFAMKSREFIMREQVYVFDELSRISGLLPYPPVANYLFIKINISNMTSSSLCEQLLRCGIAIRDCSNFTGLNDKYFRVAVRTREENNKLIMALKNVAAQFFKRQDSKPEC